MNTAVQFVSLTERKLLLALILLVCGVFYSHLAVTLTENYNDQVKSEQEEKLYEANTPPNERFSFSSCYFPPPIYTKVFWLQFFINPFLLLLMWKPSFLKTGISVIINLITVLSLCSWLIINFSAYSSNEVYRLHTEPYSYFSATSNITSILLALLSAALLTVQIWLVIRFVIEKFQDRISLK